MDPNSILVSALINVLVGAIKNFPAIERQSNYIPVIAIFMGAIIWPLYISVFTGAAIINGCLVGAGAVGLYEAAAKIGSKKKEADGANPWGDNISQ